MIWRGTTTVSDRIFSCLAYILALIDLIVLVSKPLKGSFLGPAIDSIALPLAPLISLYSNGLISFAIFLGLYVLVVRNENIRHFIRFNIMQSILFGIVLSLIGLVWGYVFQPIGLPSLMVQTIFNTVFLGGIAAIGYSMIYSALGRYAEIPTLSDAVYMQVR
jgi:hypothetical protein